MLRGIIFDLDDTLYDERQYVRGGFRAAANLLEARGFGAADLMVRRLECFHDSAGREAVFQRLAEEIGFSLDLIPDLVQLYRSHQPELSLAKDALEVLPRLRSKFRIGCVTDGWAAVQRAKVKALDVERFLDALVIADDYGVKAWKPNPFPLVRCCELLGVDPGATIMIGDNPSRDIAAARNAGIRSVRIRREGGYFSKHQDSAAADFEISQLYELEAIAVELSRAESV